MLKSTNATEASDPRDFVDKMPSVLMLMDLIIVTAHLDILAIHSVTAKMLMSVQEFMVCTVSVVMELFARTPLEVMPVLVVLDSLETQENPVPILMNAHSHLDQMENVDFRPCVPTLLEVMFVDVHLEVQETLLFNALLKITVPTMTLALGMLSVPATNVTVPLPTLGMIANVSH